MARQQQLPPTCGPLKGLVSRMAYQAMAEPNAYHDAMFSRVLFDSENLAQDSPQRPRAFDNYNLHTHLPPQVSI